MYDVDVKKIQQILEYTDRLLQETKSFASRIEQGEYDLCDLLAAQRLLQIQFEAFTDVTNLLIDGFVMRDPGGYDDMVDILDDEEVISQTTSETLRALVHFYRQSVKEYLSFDIESTKQVFIKLYPSLHLFAEEVRSYVRAELPHIQL